MNYIDQFRALAQQRAYERRVQAQGLPALLDPYGHRRQASIPPQRASLHDRLRDSQR